jgi:hypothetical protein
MFYPVLGHAIGKSGDTKRYVSGGGAVLGTWLRFGIAQGKDSTTSVTVGEKETSVLVNSYESDFGSFGRCGSAKGV